MADQTCSSCGSTMPGGAVFCTQCGSRALVAVEPPAEPEAPPAAPDQTQVVAGGPESAPADPAEPERPQVVPQPEASPPLAPPGGFVAPEAPPAAMPPPPPPAATADPTQTWSAPPVAPSAPADQIWPAAPGSGPPAAPVALGSTPPPPLTAPQPVVPPAAPAGTGWQAPTQTWDQPSAVPTPVAPVAPYPEAAPPQAVPPQPGAPAYPGYAPAPAAAPKATKTSGGGRIGAFVGLIGGALAIVGVFLAWVKIAPSNNVSYTVTGWNLSNDAKIDLAIGAVAVVLAVIVIGGRMRGFVRLLLALGGIALIGLAAYDTYDILKKLPDRLAGSFLDGGAKITGPGIGLILIFAGGALLIIGALMMKKRKVKAQGFTPT